jgi:DNA-binding IclR family transcriptional regulator
MRRESVQSLDRAIAILGVLSQTGALLGVTRLGAELHLPKSTVHRLLATLESAGFVTRSRDGQYGLGRRLWEIGCAAVLHPDARDAARPVMQALASQTGETVGLCVWDSTEAVCIAQVSGSEPVRSHSAPGHRLPAHATAAGLVLLAHQDRETQERLCHSLPRFTEKTIIDPERLLKRLQDIRRQGYAFADAAWQADRADVAAPICSRAGDVTAALSIAAPADRMASGAAALRHLVKGAADRVSQMLQAGTAARPGS